MNCELRGTVTSVLIWNIVTLVRPVLETLTSASLNQEFPYWKVGVSYKESRSFLSPKSEGRKCAKKDSLWPSERLVNFVYFCGEEGAAAERGEVRQGGIVGEERAEFLPGRVGLDVGEIEGCKLCAAITSDCVVAVLFHDAKIRKSSEICKKICQIFWYNVE